MPDDKLSAKPKIDTTDFKAGISQMNREMRVLESGFRASAAALGDWANDASGLELRIKTLNSSIDIQKQKVSAVRAEYERVKAEKGENARAAQDLEIKLNKETETLNKMENELGNTEDALQEMREGSEEAGDSVEEVGDQTEEAGEQAEEAGGKFEGLKSVFSGMGTLIKGTITVVAGLAVAVAGVTTAIGGLVFSAADAAGELVDMSAQTGISTTRLQELAYVGEQVGTSIDTITGAQSKLIRSMSGAKDGTGAQAEAFKALGVSVTDANGNLRNSEAVFADVIDALGRIPNEAERDALAMDLFGKSAMELNPLIKAGSAEMRRLTAEAHEMGAVMSEEDVSALESFGDLMSSLQAGLKGTLGTLAAAFLPAFEQVFGSVAEILKEFSAIVRGSDGDFGKLAEGLTGLLTKIASGLAQQAPQMLQAGLAIVKSILDAIIAALPSLLTAATEILTALINFIVQALPTLLQAGVEILLTLINAIITNLPMIIDAALQAVIALALGISQALPTLIPAVVEAIITIVMTLVENIPMLIDAALQLILGLAEGLVAAIPVLIPAIPVIIQALFDAIIQSLPLIGKAALELIKTLAGGIVQNLPLIGQTAVKLIDVLVKGFNSLRSELVSVGKSLVEGVWKGVQDNFNWFYNQIKNFFKNIIKAAKEALGISSPSTFGIEIGRNFMTSPMIGAQQVFRQVEQYFATAFRQLAMAPAAAGGAGSSGPSVSNRSENFQFFSPVIIQGETPADSFGASIKMKRF